MQVEEMNQAHLEEATTTIWTVQHVITTTNKRSSARNAHKKRVLAIKGQLTSSWGFFSRAIKITFHFNSEAHAEAQAEIRNKRRAGEIKRKTEGDGERQERGGTRDKQTERGMWWQSQRVEEIPARDRDRDRAREGDMWIWLQANDVMYVCQVISRRADSAECTGQDRASSATAAARWFVWCAAEITHSVERLSVRLVLPLIRSSAAGQECANVCKSDGHSLLQVENLIALRDITCFHLGWTLMIYLNHAAYQVPASSHTNTIGALKCARATAGLFITNALRL